jgi:hypothetical protein
LEFEGEAEEGSGKKSEEREAGIIFGPASPFGKRKIELGTVFIKKRRGEGSRHYRWLCFSLRETESRVRNCIYSILYHQIFFSFFFHLSIFLIKKWKDIYSPEKFGESRAQAQTLHSFVGKEKTPKGFTR